MCLHDIMFLLGSGPLHVHLRVLQLVIQIMFSLINESVVLCNRQGQVDKDKYLEVKGPASRRRRGKVEGRL